MGAPNLWALGIVLEVLSTLSGTAGKQLIRLSELSRTSSPWCAKTCFYAGLVINTVAGPVLDMAAYSFAAQSLIAPIGGLDVVWNAALAPYILKETLTRSRLYACVLIFGGTLCSGVFGSHKETQYDVKLLEKLLLDWRVVMYLVLVFVWVVFNITVPMRKPKGSIVRGISLGVTAGTIAGNMFCVKGSVELIETSIWRGKGDVWLHWLPYALLAGAAFFALSNVVFMTRGLLEFEALFMVTIYEGSMIVSNIVSACVVLLELDGLPSWRAALYIVSVLVVCAGMVGLCVSEARKGSAFKVSASAGNIGGDAAIFGNAEESQCSCEGKTADDDPVNASDVIFEYKDQESNRLDVANQSPWWANAHINPAAPYTSVVPLAKE